jgi:DNA-binding transcriptional LysR family regulator
VSRAVARLEARPGVRLLERTTRSLRLTDEGGRFYAEAAPLLAQLSDAALALTSSRQAVRGRLRVEMDPFVSRLVLAPRLDDFLVRYPLIAGTSIGTEAAIVPLAIGATPYYARIAEVSLREVDHGLIEAVRSMGGSRWTIVREVLVPEALPDLLSGLTLRW